MPEPIRRGVRRFDVPLDGEGHDPAGLRPGGWYACRHPERPVDVKRTAFDMNCPRCLVGLEAAEKILARRGIGVRVEHRTRRGVELPKRTAVADELEAATARGRRRAPAKGAGKLIQLPPPATR